MFFRRPYFNNQLEIDWVQWRRPQAAKIYRMEATGMKYRGNEETCWDFQDSQKVPTRQKSEVQ